MVNVTKSSEPSDCLMVLPARHGVVLPKSSESSDCLMVLPACRLPMVIVPKSSESSGSSYPSRRRDAPPWSSSCRSIHRHPRAPYCHRCKAGGTLFSGARRTGGSADSRRSRTPHDVVVMASASEYRRLPITPMVPRRLLLLLLVVTVMLQLLLVAILTERRCFLMSQSPLLKLLLPVALLLLVAPTTWTTVSEYQQARTVAVWMLLKSSGCRREASAPSDRRLSD